MIEFWAVGISHRRYQPPSVPAARTARVPHGADALWPPSEDETSSRFSISPGRRHEMDHNRCSRSRRPGELAGGLGGMMGGSTVQGHRARRSPTRGVRGRGSIPVRADTRRGPATSAPRPSGIPCPGRRRRRRRRRTPNTISRWPLEASPRHSICSAGSSSTRSSRSPARPGR